MSLNEIVRYIYEHSLGMFEPWEDAILELVIQPELTSDGFKIIAPAAPNFWVGMKKYKGTIFVQVHERDCNGVGATFESMASNQVFALAIYDQVVDTLLAA